MSCRRLCGHLTVTCMELGLRGESACWQSLQRDVLQSKQLLLLLSLLLLSLLLLLLLLLLLFLLIKVIQHYFHDFLDCYLYFFRSPTAIHPTCLASPRLVFFEVTCVCAMEIIILDCCKCNPLVLFCLVLLYP